MKRIILFVALLICTFIVNAQHLDFNNLQNVDSKLMSYVDFTSYTASDGTNIKIGDFVEIGKPSAITSYSHILIYVPLATPTKLSSSCEGQKFEVVRITVNGKGDNKHVGIWTKTNFAGKFIIDCELALKNGELVGNGLSSDSALAELEKAKKKLDLGLITEEEYNQKKAELIKFIK